MNAPFHLNGWRASFRQERKPEPTDRVMQIVQATAEDYELRAEDILSRSKLANVCAARDAAIYLARTTPDRRGYTPSLSTVGRWFGRDHTSILNSLRNHAKRMGAA